MDALKSHLLNLYAIALADSSFAVTELETFHQLVLKHGISTDEVNKILLTPAAVNFRVPDTIAKKVEYLYDYAKMILADGVIETSEIATLEKFCDRFGFEPENIPTIRDLLLEAAKSDVPTEELLHFVNQTA